MNTKGIGNIGEAKVLCKFVELGIPVYVPFGDNEKADLVAEFGGKLNKIQVKTSLYAKGGVMQFDITSSSVHRGGGWHIYTPEEVDYFALYNVERDKIFLLRISEVANNQVSIRYEKPKNNQTVGIKYEDDYLMEVVLSK